MPREAGVRLYETLGSGRNEEWGERCDMEVLTGVISNIPVRSSG